MYVIVINDFDFKGLSKNACLMFILIFLFEFLHFISSILFYGPACHLLVLVTYFFSFVFSANNNIFFFPSIPKDSPEVPECRHGLQHPFFYLYR
jgi:hypothetical protein